jgi:hypothetical protein
MASAVIPATVSSTLSYVQPFLAGIRRPTVGRAATWREISAMTMLAISAPPGHRGRPQSSALN